jgi:hypothetical protein
MVRPRNAEISGALTLRSSASLQAAWRKYDFTSATMLLGSGTRLFENIDSQPADLEKTRVIASQLARL